MVSTKYKQQEVACQQFLTAKKECPVSLFDTDISSKRKNHDAFYGNDQIAVMSYMLVKKVEENCFQVPVESVCCCTVHLDGDTSKNGLSTRIKLFEYCTASASASCLNCVFELFGMKCFNSDVPPSLEDYVVLFNDLAHVNLFNENTIKSFLKNLSINPEFNGHATIVKRGSN